MTNQGEIFIEHTKFFGFAGFFAGCESLGEIENDKSSVCITRQEIFLAGLDSIDSKSAADLRGAGQQRH